MDKNKIEQEDICLCVKYLCDLLRTKLFLLDNFHDYEFYSNELKKIKSIVNKIYWDI